MSVEAGIVVLALLHSPTGCSASEGELAPECSPVVAFRYAPDEGCFAAASAVDDICFAENDPYGSSATDACIVDPSGDVLYVPYYPRNADLRRAGWRAFELDGQAVLASNEFEAGETHHDGCADMFEALDNTNLPPPATDGGSSAGPFCAIESVSDAGR